MKQNKNSSGSCNYKDDNNIINNNNKDNHIYYVMWMPVLN